MTYAPIGLLTGLLLAIAGILGGFDAFLLALVLAAVGFLVGAQLDGKLDLVGAIARRGRG